MNFVDYYELMQISANAQQDTISRVYKMLASRFHPDNPETGDTDHFLKLQKAHGVLSNAEKRAAYDDDWRLHYQRPLEVFGLKDFSEGIEGENNRRMGILCLLYNRRKAACEESSLSVLQMETLMAFPREHLMFTLWYLCARKSTSSLTSTANTKSRRRASTWWNLSFPRAPSCRNSSLPRGSAKTGQSGTPQNRPVVDLNPGH
jgi:curved DNA-binding protein CbpA